MVAQPLCLLSILSARARPGSFSPNRHIDMIIDIHGHYTTEPQALHLFRDRQLAGLADPMRRPTTTDLGISDDVLRQSVEPQLNLQRERGSDLTIFSPRAAGMAHHVGTEETGKVWSRISNDVIHRICAL